ncbi:MAG: 4Fe-4S binding protein [Geitlerinemataceae cyanobacterium]
MSPHVSERFMHRVRWFLTIGWLLLIASLFYDPISPWLTASERSFSPFRLEIETCISVRGQCLEQHPYAIGADVFWGLVVPSSIFILLVFGHELWRRICPLSFLSQIPRALGIGRQLKHVDAQTGRIRYELVKIKPNSWIDRNFSYFQFGYFWVGLCVRILFVNSDRLALAFWLLFIILFAILVGYLYGGKSWCNYFCPMSPVQKIYSEPNSLLGSLAHRGEQKITQSMCRTIDKNGKEKSACVACQSSCIDIDSERSYWDRLEQRDRPFLYYGYLGVLVGYFLYYYLYAGNWTYYFSGAWAREEHQISNIWNPGFYLFGSPIPIPKLVAVPLTLGLCTFLIYWLGQKIEKWYYGLKRKTDPRFSKEQVRHRLFTLCTFVCFNLFFVFGGRPFINRLSEPGQFLWQMLIVALSTLWLARHWRRSSQLYLRESLATRLSKQLKRLGLNVSPYLDGRLLEELTPNEVYVLAKVLPGFTKEKHHEAYKGILKDALEDGSIEMTNSFNVLAQLRSELALGEEDHQQAIDRLWVECPDIFTSTPSTSAIPLVQMLEWKLHGRKEL